MKSIAIESLREQVTVAVRGAYGNGNFGDDALMMAIQMLLESCGIGDDVLYLCPRAPYLEKWVPAASIRPVSTHQWLETQLFLFGGGTQFFSYADTCRKKGGVGSALIHLHHRLSPPFLRQLVALARPAGNKTRPDYAVRKAGISVGAGPFVPGSIEETQTSNLFREMEFLSVRDENSRAFCEEIGVSPVIGTDLCFWQPFQDRALRTVDLNREPTGRIGIVVRDWPYDHSGNQYTKSLMKVVEDLRREGRDVQFFLFTPDRDLLWADQIENARFPIVRWDPESGSPQGFCEMLAQCDLLITARFHGAVFASMLGIPCICIEIEPKLSVCAEALGSGCGLWRRDFDPKDLHGLIATALRYRMIWSASMLEKANHYSRIADEMVSAFGQWVKTWHTSSCANESRAGSDPSV